LLSHNDIVLNRLFVILLLFALHVIPSCGDEGVNYCVEMDRQEGPVPFESFAEITNDSVDCWLQVHDTLLYFEPLLYRIDDQITFDSLVLCNCDEVNINFEEYTLLIGYFFIHNGPGTIKEKKVHLTCGFEEQLLGYRIIVEIPEELPGFLMPIQHNVFVPKLPDGIPIVHNVVIRKLYLQ